MIPNRKLMLIDWFLDTVPRNGLVFSPIDMLDNYLDTYELSSSGVSDDNN